ncbi:MAG TPA: SDR family oxidoreductase [Bacteroidia bacterium]|jgi:short-subunit dehydrogenase|nr:SDR family oxidoreductase [Bacteroidia bacterium]
MAFTNKTVWITGASSGIGAALVKAFAKEGANIVLSARREDELKKVQASGGLTEKNSLILPLDLSETSGVNELVKKVTGKFGTIDVLVNNGGISQRSLAKETPIDIDRKIMEVNYFGQVALTKAVLPQMLKQKSGHIIVVSSISGKFGFWFRTAYSASKHALHGFFESLRLETEHEGIKILMAVPGKIKTDISLHALKADGNKHAQMDKSQEEGMSADECAHLIIAAMNSGKEEILIGGREIKAVWLKRHFPKWFGKIIRKQPKE